MSSASHNCPSCGGSLEIEHRFSKVVICGYCGQTCSISSSGIDPSGKKVALIELDSIFSIGSKGNIQGSAFKVLGCLRYEYEDGFWDEWFIRVDSKKSIWLQEDEGEFTAFEKETLTSPVPPFSEVKVGSVISVNGMDVFVTEKCRAKISGGLGELFFQIEPGSDVDCIDGNANGKIVSLEYTKNEINLSIGEEISIDSIKIDR